jgi:hypothetical protein
MISCADDLYCQQNGGGHCLRGTCRNDDCLVDDDCVGAVCVCASDGGWGLTVHLNRCEPSTCLTDADCGPGGLCSPGHGYCGQSLGYHCRSAADTCCSSSDCAGKGDANTCEYAPALGHWQCQPPNACLG